MISHLVRFVIQRKEDGLYLQSGQDWGKASVWVAEITQAALFKTRGAAKSSRGFVNRGWRLMPGACEDCKKLTPRDIWEGQRCRSHSLYRPSNKNRQAFRERNAANPCWEYGVIPDDQNPLRVVQVKFTVETS